MLKNKIMEILNKSKELFERRKKEICIGAVGVVLLGGVGVSVAYMNNSINNDAQVSVSDKVTTDKKDKDKVSSTDKKDENKKDEVVNNLSENKDDKKEVIVSPEENTSNKDNSETSNSSSEVATSGGGSSNSSNSSSSSNQGGTSSSSSSSGSGSSGGGSKPSAPSHTHSWSPITDQVHHDEVGHWEDVVVKPAWTESIPVYEDRARDICNGCGLDITENVDAHIKEQALAGNYACGGYHTEWKQVQVGTNTVNHPAVTEKKWIVDKAAWTETVTVGHSCSCGAKK